MSELSPQVQQLINVGDDGLTAHERDMLDQITCYSDYLSQIRTAIGVKCEYSTLPALVKKLVAERDALRKYAESMEEWEAAIAAPEADSLSKFRAKHGTGPGPMRDWLNAIRDAALAKAKGGATC